MKVRSSEIWVLDSSKKRKVFFEWLQQASSNLELFSPYLSLPLAEQIIHSRGESTGSVFVRGEREDFRSGVLSIDALSAFLMSGWKVFFNFRLHAKVYIDGREGFLGSANLTQNGFNPYPLGNFESLIKLPELGSDFLSELQIIKADSTEIRNSDILILKAWLAKQPKQTPSSQLNEEFPLRQLHLRKLRKTNTGYSLLDIIQSGSLAELQKQINANEFNECVKHDLELLDLRSDDLDLAQLKSAFRELPLIKDFLNFVGGGKRFGELRSWLESHIQDVPTPSRQDFNEHLNRLYALVVEAFDGEYERYRPNHTEFLICTSERHKFR